MLLSTGICKYLPLQAGVCKYLPSRTGLHNCTIDIRWKLSPSSTHCHTASPAFIQELKCIHGSGICKTCLLVSTGVCKDLLVNTCLYYRYLLESLVRHHHPCLEAGVYKCLCLKAGMNKYPYLEAGIDNHPCLQAGVYEHPNTH